MIHTIQTITGGKIAVDKYQFNYLVRAYNDVTRFANKAKATATVTTKDIFNEVHAVDLRSNFKSKRDID